MKKLAAITCAAAMSVLTAVSAFALGSTNLKDDDRVISLSPQAAQEVQEKTNLEAGENVAYLPAKESAEAVPNVDTENAEVTAFNEAFLQQEATWTNAVAALKLEDTTVSYEDENGQIVVFAPKLEDLKPMSQPLVLYKQLPDGSFAPMAIEEPIELPLPTSEFLEGKKAEDLIVMILYMDGAVEFTPVTETEGVLMATFPVTNGEHGPYEATILSK